LPTAVQLLQRSNRPALNPAYGQDVIRATCAFPTTDSGQVEVSHLFSHGFQIRGNYTTARISMTLRRSSQHSSSPTSFAANLVRVDFGRIGALAYDHRHYLAITYVWAPAGFQLEQPVFDGALNVFTRNWSISGISNSSPGRTAPLLKTSTRITTPARPTIVQLLEVSQPYHTAGEDGFFLKGGTPGSTTTSCV